MLFDDIEIKRAIERKAEEVKLSGKVEASLVSSYVSKACSELNIDPSSIRVSIGYRTGMLLGETIVRFSYSSSSNNERVDYQEYQEQPQNTGNNGEMSDDYLVIRDTGQTSFLNQLKLSSGHYKFEIHTRDPNSISRIISNERYKLLEAEEGINLYKFEPKGGVKMFNVSFSFGRQSGEQVLLFEYILGMPLTQFLDHRKKGIEKSSLISPLFPVFCGCS